MTRRNGAYWLDRLRRERMAGDRTRQRVAFLAYLMCVAAECGVILNPIQLGD